MTQRRRKKKNSRGIIGLFILFLFLTICIIIAKFLADIIFDLIGSEHNNLDNATSQYESITSEISDDDKKELINTFKTEGYPESLIELFDKHPETKEFVQDYPKYKNSKKAINIKKDVTKGEIPLFLQWDKRWGYRQYGNDFIAITGCGPTCLAMVRCGLSGSTKWNPYRVAKMADANGFYVEGSGSSWSLMTDGAQKIGLSYHEVNFEKDSILSELYSGNPIICSMGPGDFTTTGHFIVLTGADKNGNIIVRDPNSLENSNKTWNIDTIMSQVRNLWGYSV